MSSAAIRFALLAIAVVALGVTAFRDEHGNVIKDMSARKHAEYLDRIEGIHCPPLGLTDRFNVSVIDAGGSRVSGCSYIQRNTSVSPSQLLHLWLRRSRNSSVGHCGNMENMDHFMFECLSKTHEKMKEQDESGWKYVSLFQHSIFEHYTRFKQNESNRLGYRCAGPHIPTGQPQWPDRSVVLILDKEVVDPESKRRSADQDDGCSFPDWSQGLWSDLQVYGNMAYYSTEFPDVEDVDDVEYTGDYGSESTTMDSLYQDILATINSSFANNMTLEQIRRARRDATELTFQQIKTTRFKWRCTMSVHDLELFRTNETEAKFLTYGGRIVEKDVLKSTDNKNDGQESDTLDDIAETTTKTYGCLLLQSRGLEICYSVIATGVPEENQDIQKFAMQLCNEKNVLSVLTQKKICARRPHLSF